MTNEFSVYWWDQTGGQYEELRFVSAEEATKAAQRLTKGPASRLGIVDRVIITDGVDCICFEWNARQGLIFPMAGSKRKPPEAKVRLLRNLNGDDIQVSLEGGLVYIEIDTHSSEGLTLVELSREEASQLAKALEWVIT